MSKKTQNTHMNCHGFQSVEEAEKVSNVKRVLECAGSISDEEAARMRKIIDEEFNTIEGEW